MKPITNPVKRVKKKCYCKFNKKGKLVGLCLRCFERESNAFNRGRMWAFKTILRNLSKLTKQYEP